VVERVSQKTDTPEGIENAARWARAQDRWRIPTRQLLLKPEDFGQEYKDDQNQRHVVIQGHIGAVYHPKILDDETLDLKTISPQTVHTGEMHSQLDGAFHGTEDVEVLRGQITTIAERFMWDGLNVPGNVSDLHKSNLGGTPVAVSTLQANAQKGTQQFNCIIGDSLGKTPKSCPQ
jgi:hypothetical protein